MATVLLVHGFASKGGKGSTDKLRDYFYRANYRVYELDYGWTLFPTYTRANKKLALSWVGWAKALAGLQKDLAGGTHLIGVGHSNGCAILRLACWLGAPFTQLVFINPALNTKGRKTHIGLRVDKVHVWHSPSDKAVRIARWIPFHPWGRMGAVGYQGKDPRYVNYDKENDFDLSSSSHGDVFDDEKLEYFGPLIVHRVTANLSTGS